VSTESVAMRRSGSTEALGCADAPVPCHRGSGGANVAGQATVATLEAFLEAFNRHDLDAVMGFFADDCVLYMPRGAGPRGDRYVGKDEERAGLAAPLAALPDVHYGEARHWTCGDLAAADRTVTGTATSGDAVEVRG